MPAPAGDPAGIIDPGASLRGGTRRRNCRASAGLDDAMVLEAAYRGSLGGVSLRLVAPGGGPELPTSTAFSIVWNSCRASIFPPICWRPFLRNCSSRGSATSQTGCAIFRVIAVSPSSPSVPWSGAALRRCMWSRPMTGSRPDLPECAAAQRGAFRILLRDTLASFPGPLERRCSRKRRALERPSRLPAAGRSSKALSVLRLSS